MDYEKTLNIFLIGERSVGKSSIVLAYTKKEFDESLHTTVGIYFKSIIMDFCDYKVKICLWDTSGQDRYKDMTSNFYRNMHGAILVYDTSRPETLAKLKERADDIQQYSTKKNMVCFVVGNKIDKERAVPKKDGLAFAQKHNMLFAECSAKTNEGIKFVFEELLWNVRCFLFKYG
ncbi:ras-related protein Rab-18-like [Achroia grisella]|uniref:ras-related protein Rab-18-like n=1 Tax=Achroia grisella TaxID=688607 RepID=UPI0027D34F51|nr:ras-related protein Rab-18-like [Achroia grisella]